MKFDSFAHVLYCFSNIDYSLVFTECSKAEYTALSCMYEHMNVCGVNKINVKEIAKESNVSMPAISRLLKNLESKKFVKRSIDCICRRNIDVKLTEKGIKVVEETNIKLKDFFESAFVKLSEEDQQNILKSYGLLYDLITKN
jgi:DNA-binding MarR family transcriptional regulator